MAHRNTQAQLEALSNTIAEICRISGTPGVSIGVQHRQGVYLHNHGFKDVQKQTEPTSETNYCIASMSKAFTSAAIGILVEEGKLEWDTLIKDVLPGFNSREKTITENATVADLLAHRTGLQRADSMWRGAENELLLDQKDTISVFATLEAVNLFRDSFQYNNWAYALAGEIIEHLAGESYAEFVTRKIMRPLGMLKTLVIGKTGDMTNVAEAYQTLDDGSPWQIPRPHEDGKMTMAAASGIRSNVIDLLKFYKAILRSGKAEPPNKATGEADVLKQLPTILASHQAMTPNDDLKKFYGLGWARAQLPTTMGDIGTNPSLVSQMPVVARGGSGLCYWHQGSLIGYTSFVALLPEEDAAIVVLTNSTALNDAADWIGQMLVETVLDSPEKSDYVQLANESATAAMKKAWQLDRAMEEQRIYKPEPGSLEKYTGTFADPSRNFIIDISTQDGDLMIAFQGRSSQKYKLKKYHDDTFCWYLSFNEQAKRAMWFNPDSELYMIEFHFVGHRGRVHRLVWKFDAEVADGAVFLKSGWS